MQTQFTTNIQIGDELRGINSERQGFEPWIQFYPYNGLANRRLQPLGHLSKDDFVNGLPFRGVSTIESARNAKRLVLSTGNWSTAGRYFLTP